TNNFNHELLNNVNQTLIFSRQLTLISDQLDQQIIEINQEIDQKLLLLDELELDYALQDNIDLDSLDEQQTSPIISLKSITVPSRPTAIVEPNFSRIKSKESLKTNILSRFSLDNLRKTDENLSNQSSIHLIPISISYCNSMNNDESDTGISSTHSN
ncbi:unnamed protein product, partial [Adineta ricciae]